MKRDQVYNEMKEMFGTVPMMFKDIPENVLTQEWETFKEIELSEKAPIPNKYRELIGLGIAAVTRCKYCSLFHTEMAKLHGATEKEIQNALHFAKHTAGWSSYVNGGQLDYDEFSKEVRKMVNYVKTNQPRKKAV